MHINMGQPIKNIIAKKKKPAISNPFSKNFIYS